jgi:hypothetical protein
MLSSQRLRYAKVSRKDGAKPFGRIFLAKFSRNCLLWEEGTKKNCLIVYSTSQFLQISSLSCSSKLSTYLRADDVQGATCFKPLNLVFIVSVIY